MKNQYKSRKSPSQKRSKLTVEYIKEAALDLASRQGFSELNTTQISKRAGVSKGSLYQYFPSREAIFLSLFEDATTHLAMEMKAMYVRILNVPPEKGMPTVIRHHLKIVRQNKLVILQLPLQVPQLQYAFQPVTYENMIDRFTRMYIQEQRPNLSKKEVEHRSFFIHVIVKSSIENFIINPPPAMSDQIFINELAKIITNYSVH